MYAFYYSRISNPGLPCLIHVLRALLLPFTLVFLFLRFTLGLALLRFLPIILLIDAVYSV
jgi:hypothetical protein